MKKLILLFLLPVLLFSCKNNSEENKEKLPKTVTSTGDNGSIEKEKTSNLPEQDSPQEESTNDNLAPTNNSSNPSARNTLDQGIFIKTDGGTACNCNCLDIIPGNTSELCVVSNEIYIDARYEKVGNTIEVYYSGKSSKTTRDDMPWEKFDKNVPIAVLNGSSNKLDWKGFSLNGKVAVDYALIGKKNLEGNYKKQ